MKEKEFAGRRLSELKVFLDRKVEYYNRPAFIKDDPVSIPHLFTKQQDIEIAGFWAAVLAWGQRKTIIRKCKELFELMDGAPHDFLLNHQEDELKPFLAFKHRTFNATDTLYFIEFLSWFYRNHFSLEEGFAGFLKEDDEHIGPALEGFHKLFFSLPDAPDRTRKHIATPARKAACKRLAMFMRWMVRADGQGVDFGIWKKIKPSQLICPCDVHVDRVSRKLGLIQRKQTDWLTALELTRNLKLLDPADPVKYDFALFGLGVEDEL